MLASLRPSPGKRWPRGQKFRLSAQGLDALRSHREAIQEAHALPGRAALEAIQRAWSDPLGIEPGDGIVLAELTKGRIGMGDVVRALEPCGVSAAEVKASVDRLVSAGMVEPIPLASQVGP